MLSIHHLKADTCCSVVVVDLCARGATGRGAACGPIVAWHDSPDPNPQTFWIPHDKVLRISYQSHSLRSKKGGFVLDFLRLSQAPGAATPLLIREYRKEAGGDLWSDSVLPRDVAGGVTSLEQVAKQAAPIGQGSWEQKAGSQAWVAEDCASMSHILQEFDAAQLPLRCSNFEELHQGTKKNTTGTGSKRKVIRGEWNGTAVAVKQFRSKKLTPEKLLEMRTEAALHYHLRGAANIVGLLGLCGGKQVFELMPLPLAKACPLPASRVLEVSLDVARAVAQVHGARGGPFVHRDVTALNFFLDARGRAVLQDFGAAQYVGLAAAESARAGGSEWGGGVRRCWAGPTVCGAGGVRRCPEEMVKMLDGELALEDGERLRWEDVGLRSEEAAQWSNLSSLRAQGLGLQMDVFHLGLVLWHVITGSRMHQHANGVLFEWRAVWREVLTGAWPGTVLDMGQLAALPEMREILRACWAFDPAQRPSAAHVAQRIQSVMAAHHHASSTAAVP